MSRENLPMRKALRGGRAKWWRPGQAGATQTASAVAALAGDPTGTKARAASARSRHAEPMHPIDRQWNYLEQTRRSALTPRQVRRQSKALRREGHPITVSEVGTIKAIAEQVSA